MRVGTLNSQTILQLAGNKPLRAKLSWLNQVLASKPDTISNCNCGQAQVALRSFYEQVKQSVLGATDEDRAAIKQALGVDQLKILLKSERGRLRLV